MIKSVCIFLQYLMLNFIVIIVLINTRALLALDDRDLARYPAREKYRFIRNMVGVTPQ
nr:MAG TPA: hypothetical protein [Caudoviricetes sp.]